MKILSGLTGTINSLTSIVIALLGLAIVVSLLGGNVPFVGGVADNIVGLVQGLGDAGIVGYLNKFLEVGVLLLAVSVIAEILFGPNVAFFGSKVTSNLINLLNTLGEQGVAALIIVFAVIFAYRKLLK